MDVFDQDRRSQIMGLIKGANTRPELAVRQLTHGLGYRFRLHRRELPGRPDLVFPGRKSVIFVHGCFWHQHEGCRKRSLSPKSNEEFWLKKLSRNRERDRENVSQLETLGWKVMVIWECEIGNTVHLQDRLQSFLGPVAQR